MEQAQLTTEEVLKRDIPWETYMMTKLISGTDLQLLRRYDNRPESYRAQLLDDDGPAYVRVFVTILRDIFKEETVEYILALIDEMLTANPKRARLFHDKSLANDDSLLWKGNWFIQEKSCKILALIVSARPRTQDCLLSNGEASNSKSKINCVDDVLKGLVEWLCAQLKKPLHPSRSIPTAVSCLATLLKEPVIRSMFVQGDGVMLLIPLICPASTQQSIQLLYETCLCVWLLSYYEPAIEYLAASRSLLGLVDVAKSSTKEKVVRVVVLTFRNLLFKGTFGPQMVDLGLPQIVQNLKAQAWNDEDLLEALNQLEDGLRDNIKKLSSFEKYKQEVLLGHLDWSPMHKDPAFWRENITNFEENDFQILRVLITILDTSNYPRALAGACFDLSQFIKYHPAGRVIVTDLKAKERVMKLMNHENAEVTKNALLCIQRLFLGAKYASFLQLLYETCLCVWLLSYYEPAIEYLAASRSLLGLVDVAKSSTKEKVVRVVVLTFRNLLFKGTFGPQMVDLGLPQIVQNLKAQAWNDEDLLEALNQLEDGLRDNIKKLSSFEKYKQEVLLGHLDWSPMHKDPAFWRENITNFEENDFQILRVLITILDTSNYPRALAVACFDLSQFIKYHPAGRVIVTDLKAKERVMKLMNHENAEVTKNALLCIQRLFLGAKYASFLQV